MTGFAAIAELAGESGRLNVVRGRAEPFNRFPELGFELDAATFVLACDDDTDEILVSRGVAGGGEGDAQPPGYADGLQLRLRERGGREVVVQFEVAASAMDVSLFQVV